MYFMLYLMTLSFLFFYISIFKFRMSLFVNYFNLFFMLSLDLKILSNFLMFTQLLAFYFFRLIMFILMFMPFSFTLFMSCLRFKIFFPMIIILRAVFKFYFSNFLHAINFTCSHMFNFLLMLMLFMVFSMKKFILLSLLFLFIPRFMMYHYILINYD